MRWRFSCQFAIITNMLFDRAGMQQQNQALKKSRGIPKLQTQAWQTSKEMRFYLMAWSFHSLTLSFQQPVKPLPRRSNEK